ncbi:MAG: adenylyltransferase/cytidyltransferase family protein [archaeon]
MKKIKTHPKKEKRVRVLAQGTFDILHPGHVHYLSFAKEKGSHLIAIIARDVNVKRFKGASPVNDESARRRMVAALKPVDEAVLGGKGDILSKVIQIRPDVIVLGYDQRTDEKGLIDALAVKGIHCQVIRAPPYGKKRYKSNLIKRRIVQSFQKTST